MWSRRVALFWNVYNRMAFLLERQAPWHVLHKNPARAAMFRAPVTDTMDTILNVVERTEILLGFSEHAAHAKLAAAI